MRETSKLEEAEYFLGEMRRPGDSRQPFVYSLSAFLAAARSALQYACLEAAGKPGGQAWYDGEVTGHSVIKFFKDKRDLNIHAEPVEPSAHIGIELRETLRLSESLTVEVVHGGEVVGRFHSESPHATAEADPPTTIRLIYRFDDWKGGGDVLDLCRTYFQELRRVVTDGQNRGFLTK